MEQSRRWDHLIPPGLHSTDDLPSREIWRHYRSLMEAR